MKISVIVPHKNDYDRLARLLSTISIDPSIQLIVVDDGSDNKKKVNHIVSNHPQGELYHCPTGNSNAGVARNVGLAAVRSPWVVFADSDDYFCEDAFRNFLKYTESNPDSDLYFFCVDSETEGNKTVSNRHLNHNANITLFLEIGALTPLRYSMPTPWGKMIRTSLIQDNNIKFSERVAGNDATFSMCVGDIAKSIYVTASKYYMVTEREGSLTSNLTPEKARSRLVTLIECNTLLYRRGVYQYMQWGITYYVNCRPLMTVINNPILTLKYFRTFLCTFVAKTILTPFRNKLTTLDTPFSE